MQLDWTLTHPLPLSISSLLQAPFGSEQRWDFVPSSMIVCSQYPHVHLSVAQSGWSNRCEGFKWQVVWWVLCVAALWCQGTKKPTSVLLSYTIGGVLTSLLPDSHQAICWTTSNTDTCSSYIPMSVELHTQITIHSLLPVLAVSSCFHFEC